MKNTLLQDPDLSSTDIINLRDFVLQSPYFQQRHRSKEILAVFFQKALNARSKRERYVNLEEIINSYSPTIIDEPSARAQLRAIMKDQLPRFFVLMGKGQPFKAEIVKDKETQKIWYLEFSKNDPAVGDCVTGFWHEYIETHENLLVLGESLFFRDRKRNVIRNWTTNHANDRKELYALAGKQVEDMEPTVYVNLGQVKASFALTEMFQEHRAQLKYQSSTAGLLDHMTERNLILLGNPRTNEVLSTVQEKGAFRLNLRDRWISDDGRRIEDKTCSVFHGTCYHAVLTRCPNFRSGHIITAIASNYGRSVAGVAGFLSRQAELAELYRRLGLQSASDPLPSRFQILFKVSVSEETALQTLIEKVYTYDPKPILLKNGAHDSRKLVTPSTPAVTSSKWP